MLRFLPPFPLTTPVVTCPVPCSRRFALPISSFANRIVVSPMCQYSADDGVASDWHINHLGALANSGAGAGRGRGHRRRAAAAASPTAARPLFRRLRSRADARASRTAAAIGTAKVGIQIAHAGRKASAARPWEGGHSLDRRRRTRGRRSRRPRFRSAPNWHAPRAMTADRHGARARRVRERGEARGAQSASTPSSCTWRTAICCTASSRRSPTSATTNMAARSPARMRFPLEVAQAVRAVVPKGTPLGARITGTDWVDGGLTPDDAVVVRQGAQGGRLRFRLTSRPARSARTSRPTQVRELQRAVRRQGQARGRHCRPARSD